MNLFDDKLVSIDQNKSHLLKIRKRSQEEAKASLRSAMEDLADKNLKKALIVGDMALFINAMINLRAWSKHFSLKHSC